MKKQKDLSGFTIIELLIVIVVIGILAAITIVAYNGVQQKSRDAARDASISSLKRAIEMYSAENGVYPPACTDDSSCNLSTLTAHLVPTYIASMPTVAAVSSSTTQYARRAGGTGYGLNVVYETKARCVTGVNTNPVWGWFVSSNLPMCT